MWGKNSAGKTNNVGEVLVHFLHEGSNEDLERVRRLTVSEYSKTRVALPQPQDLPSSSASILRTKDRPIISHYRYRDPTR